MTEQGHNTLPAENEKRAEKLDDEPVPDDAWPLCPSCLSSCHPLQYYCYNCDSSDAINPLTPYMGFVNIRFNYGIFLTMWRKVWYEKDTSTIAMLFYLFLIILHTPIIPIVIISLPLSLIGKIKNLRLQKQQQGQ